MTLYRQLGTTVFVIFTLVFCIAFYTVFLATKEQYLSAHSEHFSQLTEKLSRQISPLALASDWDRATTLLVEQQEQFSRVSVKNDQGEMVLSLAGAPSELIVPTWFSHYVAIAPLQITQSLPTQAQATYQVIFQANIQSQLAALWQQAKQLFGWLLLIYIVAVVLALVLIKRLLMPLMKVSDQAQAMRGANANKQLDLPQTQELQEVVKTLNEMHSTINQQFKQQAEVAETIRDKIYRDEVTGLGNRAYFMGQAKTWIAESGSGGVALISLDILEDVYLEQGEAARDHLAKASASTIQAAVMHNDQVVLARLSINEFAVILPGLEADQLLHVAEVIQDALSDLVVSPLEEASSISYIGLVLRQQEESITELLCRADNALQISRTQRLNPIHLIKCSERFNLGRAGWKHLVQDAIHQDLFAFKAQPVVMRETEQMLHGELFSYIDKDGQHFFASQFMAAIEHFKLGCLFDQYVLKKVPQQLALEAFPCVAVNLTMTSCLDEDFHLWLARFLRQHPELKTKLVVELPETACFAHQQEIMPLLDIIKQAGLSFGIDQFGRHFQSLTYLEQLCPAYVKVDYSYTNQVEEVTGDSEFLDAVCQAALKLGIVTVATRVESQAQLERLSRLHIDAYQGFISPPQKISRQEK
ncbi:EAL domain-containing protein [Motilimonas eburnea]|uniref:EAL domain-containing protein n=1 Tax=Motilimonas eburnea TaxID=1737488 RepID=UPI001E651E5A|nr:EAL domain-containing protein [Motilimonas eburnea]MCE2571016.1 EAL domain-containing protein [Motilimonas eburnea]